MSSDRTRSRQRTRKKAGTAVASTPRSVAHRPTARTPGVLRVADVQRLAGNGAAIDHVQRDRSTDDEEVVAADAAAKAINDWLVDNNPGGQAVNYCVGVATNGDLYISKVEGVTAATKYTQLIADHITANRYHHGRDIFLAQKFNASVGSNHAEMCIMAAAGRGAISKIYCSGPHCGFCGTFMASEGVTLGAAQGGDSQTGWSHPFAPVAYGTQLRSPASSQVAELKALPADPTKADVAHGQWLTTSPKTGKRSKWL